MNFSIDAAKNVLEREKACPSPLSATIRMAMKDIIVLSERNKLLKALVFAYDNDICPELVQKAFKAAEDGGAL